ncbi:hypothetical protein WGT02_08330 [Rhizobium sp. T1470]|uniref:hypothetical protein n=1 Tax=unclassified Rhizobium TaxID=2613769 RepID=UPI001AAF1C4F|nr:hypothetical protein [Rhizobium sp. T1473]MCA0801286.1 hypothetical protein [Rhizobium sp. T1473]
MKYVGWSIIDKATHMPARLDGVPLVSLEADEAKDMRAILEGIDRIRSDKACWVSFVKQQRLLAKKWQARQLRTNECAASRSFTGFCGQGRSKTDALRGRRREATWTTDRQTARDDQAGRWVL